MDWTTYRALCDRGDVLSRFLLEHTARLLEEAGEGALGARLAAHLEHEALPRPPGHKAGAEADFFRVRLAVEHAERVLGAVDARLAVPGHPLAGRRTAFVAAWREYRDWITGVHPRSDARAGRGEEGA